MELIDIIIPVYDGLRDTQNCLISLSESLKLNDIRCNVIVINDKSPNQDLTEWLRSYSALNQFQLIENETNLGFVATVNKGMGLSRSRDVILLNSDTVVVNDWIDRLIDCAYSNPRAGTVTPVSNNATICSFPKFCQENVIPKIGVSKLDNIFSSVNYGCSVEIPTGVGFCMLIKRDCLNEIGLFNEEAFGRGYGEENDFCRRAVEIGWENIYCLDTFVAHVGSVSFSSDKKPLVDKAMVKIEELHPGYHQRVESHIRKDPARLFRIRAYLDMFHQSTVPNILLVSHNLGGGVETHVQELIQIYDDLANFLVLKCKEDQTYVLSLGQIEEEFHFEIPNQYDELIYLLNIIGLSRVHFHHIMGLHPILWRLAQDLSILMDCTVHDFYFINSSPTLTDKEGFFCSDIETRDQLCSEVYPLPSGLSPEGWRDATREFLNRCNRIIFPSRSAAEIFKTYFPEYDVTVAYHPDSEMGNFPEPTGWKPNKKELNILTLGAISREKGADLLEQTAKLAEENNLSIHFHLLGYAYRPLHDSVSVYGPYHSENLAEKLANINPDLIWLPALWPETYSYTLSESLFSGVPVIVPDIGAFPERIAGRPWAQVYPWKSSPEKMVELFSMLKREGISQVYEQTSNKLSDNFDKSFYRNYYLPEVVTNVKPAAYYISNEWIDSFLAPKTGENDLSQSEKILVKMFNFRGTMAGRALSQMIPIRFQRKIKKWLSQRPIHELTS
ncbi:glycosyltransferase [Gimesia aquarii]|uniref:N-glycosyltransferase n=1 Tax=Gimesia aquarii TaxID=2527964 RepID=A0A517X0C1_9PLAN|nr:glycosyltransferase [Gimesia aquarii]QDU10958.1 N-glycosyltransferase [Gimesia aquarii]